MSTTPAPIPTAISHKAYRELTATVCQALGVEPKNVASILLRPASATVSTYIRDKDGLVVSDWKGAHLTATVVYAGSLLDAEEAA